MPSGIILWYFKNNRGYIENETESGHLEMAYRNIRRLGKKGGLRRMILIRFILFTEKLEVLFATRNLTGIQRRTEQDQSMKEQKITDDWFHIWKMPDNRKTWHTFQKTNWWYPDEYMLQNFYKKIARYRTPTKQWITLQQGIMIQVSNHHGHKYQRSTDRRIVQLEDMCCKQGIHSCRVMNEEDRRAGSQHKQVTLKNHLWSVISSLPQQWWQEHYSVRNSEYIRRKALEH